MKLTLPKTELLLKEKVLLKDFDSYAVYIKAGSFSHTLYSEGANDDTLFDIASCGKVLVTTPLVLQAVGEGKLSLESTLSDFFVNTPTEKKAITIKQLLTHTSGIVRIQMSEETARKGRYALAEQIFSAPLAFEPGSDYIYSCNGMILLGFILEIIYGDTLENIFERHLKVPLGYTRSTFNAEINDKNLAICYRSKDVEGLAHPWDDENVRVMKTSAGSGGQFFTLADIKKFANAVLSKDERLYKKYLFEQAEKPYTPSCASETRGLGWVFVDEKYKQTGSLFPKGSFGHCGHTGQSIFFNREKDMCVVILTNATRFANQKNDFNGYNYIDIMKLREEIHNTIKQDLGDV